MTARTVRKSRRRGTALLITVIMIFCLLALTMVATQGTLLQARAAREETGTATALWAAEAGVGLALNELNQAEGAAEGTFEYALQDGASATVTVEPQGTLVRVTSTGVVDAGTPGEGRRTVEVFVRSETHPLFYKATYVGNSQQVEGYALTFGPNLPTTQGGAKFKESSSYNRNTLMVEADHQVDFNADGDLEDRPTIGDIYTNRVAWGWSGSVTSSGSNRQLDINRDKDYKDTVTAPTVQVEPTPRDPTRDEPAPTPDADWATSARTNDADYVEGDVYVNGDVALNGGTNAFGDVDATGAVTGDPVTGTVTEQTKPIAPPDLSAMNYEAIADEVVEEGSKASYIQGEQSASTYGPLGGSGTHDNPHFHLQNGDSHTLSFGKSADGTLVLVKGNLWIHDLSSFTIDMPKGSDVRVTIVVEGNLYIADDLQYNNGDNGLLFIVKANDEQPESYIDANRNYRYDAGETVLDDDGDGKYEGPIEGQGNVFFGDPRYGTGGVTDGYVYAQNNVYLVNPPISVSPPEGQDTVFGVYGFLSAGGIMDLGPRGAGSAYNNFRVQYDPRLQDGAITFKGMPRAQGGGFQGLTVVSWRELP